MVTGLYSLFIWPISALIEFLFLFNMRWLDGNAGLSVIFLSLLVNIIILPFYNVSERWQSENRDLMSKMKSKLARIKAVFKGDERQLITNTYYRQMGYHPLSSIRSTLGLLIQVPFFLAAYGLIAHNRIFDGINFLFLRDLSQPDQLLSIGGLTLNLLPILMTVFNLLSAFIYTKGLSFTEKAQLYGFALIFLVLLYQMPSAMVLYWTLNNLFSLGKNIVKATPRPRLVGYGLLSLAAVFFTVATFFSWIPGGSKRLVIAGGLTFMILIFPLAWKFLKHFFNTPLSPDLVKHDRKIFYLSMTNLFLLTGVLIPTLLMASSPSEFKDVPRLLFQTILQSVSLFLLIPALIRALSPDTLKRYLSPLAAILIFVALVNTFFLSTGGALSNSFIFTNQEDLVNSANIGLSILGILVAASLVWLFYFFKKKALLTQILMLCAISVGLSSIVTLVTINTDLAKLETTASSTANEKDDTSKPVTTVFNMSKTGKNVFILFLDKAIGAALPRALEGISGFKDELEGFTWYKKTISFGPYTILTVPSLLGGYEYTPSEINLKKTGSLAEKYNEGLKVLPYVFGEADYRVTFSDPSYAGLRLNPPDTSIFDGMKNVKALNIKGKLKTRFLREKGFSIENQNEQSLFEYDILLRFSLFRIAPPVIRPIIYRNGVWWKSNSLNISFDESMKSFSNLYYLQNLISVQDSGNNLNIFINESTHDSGSYNPRLEPDPWPFAIDNSEINKYGSKESAEYSYSFLASMVEVKKWLKWLKSEDLYDNTRIIITADHGGDYNNNLFDKSGLERYNPLFLVKDYEQRQPLVISQEFMTNADLNSIAIKGMGPIKNPYTGKILDNAAKSGPILVHEGLPAPQHHGPTGYLFQKTWEIHNQSPFEAANWMELK